MSTRRVPCPACDRGPRDKAMVVTTDERGMVSYCHRCHRSWSTSPERHEHRPADLVSISRHAEPLEWSERAESIWCRGLPLCDSLAELYLRNRGCLIPPADADLRFLPPCAEYAPAMVARVTDAVSARPISLHITELSADGLGRGARRLLAGHRKRGGVIRLWADHSVAYGLAVAEGIETALAAAHLFNPVWACIDAGNLAALPVLAGVDCLAIYADHDDAGMRAAQACAKRWDSAEREVAIYRPRVHGEDIADVVKRRIA